MNKTVLLKDIVVEAFSLLIGCKNEMKNSAGLISSWIVKL